jgi:hypothetical protein
MIGELKPCPFCRSADVIPVFSSGERRLAIRCMGCGYYGPAVVFDRSVPPMPCDWEAIRANWNSRADVDYGELNSLLKNIPVSSKPPLTLNSARVSLLQFVGIAHDLIELYPFLYVEIARTRTTGWMVWLRVSPDGKLLANGQGEELDHACKDAIKALTASGGANG